MASNNNNEFLPPYEEALDQSLIDFEDTNNNSSNTNAANGRHTNSASLNNPPPVPRRSNRAPAKIPSTSSLSPRPSSGILSNSNMSSASSSIASSPVSSSIAASPATPVIPGRGPVRRGPPINAAIAANYSIKPQSTNENRSSISSNYNSSGGRPSMKPPPVSSSELQEYSLFQQQHPQDYVPLSKPPPTWNVQNAPQWKPPSQQYLQQSHQSMSNCSGNKKALFIGINYFNTKNQLRGCINDAYAMRNFLTTFGFRNDPAHMLCLTDDQRSRDLRPTRQNIIQALLWLVRGAQPGDSLFLHYSGHGIRVEDLDGDESDGYDEAICPEDFKVAGPIIDDEMNTILVRGLPAGARLTAIYDCCHSGSILDLPYTYYSDGRIKEHTAMNRVGRVAKDTLNGGLYGGIIGAGISLIQSTPQLFQKSQSIETKVMLKGNQHADVILFSGCKDSQTSADANFMGMNAGAMTYAFTQALYQYRTPTYAQLLEQIRNILGSKYSQKPQLSTSRLIDMNQLFKM